MKPQQPCPCGADACYAPCCGRFLDGGLFLDTAEALMRSRYVAYTQGRADYLLQTWTGKNTHLEPMVDHGECLGLFGMDEGLGGRVAGWVTSPRYPTH